MLSLWIAPPSGEGSLWAGDYPVHADALLEATNVLLDFPACLVSCYANGEPDEGTHQWSAWRESIHDNFVTVHGPMFEGKIDITEDIT